jgi:hypothetical protein
VAKLTTDATMKTFFPAGVVNISYRPTRRASAIPLITMFDFGDRADDSVPLWDRNHQIDIWHSDLDAAEDIKQRLIELLDLGSLSLPTEGLAARVQVVSDVDSPQDDGDLVRKTVRVRIMAYDYVTPYTTN